MDPNVTIETPIHRDDEPILDCTSQDTNENLQTSAIQTQLNSSSVHNSSTSNGKSLGMFFGVVVPCTLSMFSIVLFLRVGYLVGFAGTIGGLAIIFTSYFIISMTVLSLCALCTNGRIQAGGAYYMISRTLGPEFGASIGLMFFIANVASCALYIFGFIEILLASFSIDTGSKAKFLPEGYWFHFLYATMILVLCTCICMIGSSAYSKSVVFIFVLIITCLISIFTSFFTTPEFAIESLPSNRSLSLNYTSFSWETWDSNHRFIWSDPNNIDYLSESPVDILTVFAVFFNGCIGVMAGVNVSGELLEPNKAIPKGTILACAFTSSVYVILSLFVAATCNHDLLTSDYTILQKINFCPMLIFVGVGCASVSAVLSNMIGASRVLYAIADDKIFGRSSGFTNFLTKTSEDGNPYGSVIFTFCLILCFFLLGNLNAVAPIVTTFFLMAYAAVDGACLALTVTSAPNFRPTFRYFNSMTCCIGLIGTLFMMVLVSPIYAFFSCVIFAVLFVSIHLVSNAVKSENSDAWGHISQALIYHQVRKYLLKLDSKKDHVKYWRPQILILHKNAENLESLNFANDFKKSGLLVIGHVIKKTGKNFSSDGGDLRTSVDGLKIKAFFETTRCNTVREGSEQLLRLSGLGGMKPNMLMVGFYEKIQSKIITGASQENNNNSSKSASDLPSNLPDHTQIAAPSEYVHLIRDALALSKNICLHRDLHSLYRTDKGFIDVYPFIFMLDREKSNFYRNFAFAQVDEISEFMDNSSLFILQMACILSMSEHYKSRGIIGSGGWGPGGLINLETLAPGALQGVALWP